jgi:hypothetical protein
LKAATVVVAKWTISDADAYQKGMAADSKKIQDEVEAGELESLAAAHAAAEKKSG